MLKPSKMLFSASRISNGVTYSKMIWQYRTRLSLNEKTVQKAHYARALVYKTPLAPEITRLQDMILYSDYIENQRYHLGYKGNKRIQAMREQNDKSRKMDDMMNSPAISVALKYLGHVKPAPEEKDQQTNFQAKPIYMPYAAEDKFETSQVEIEEEEEEDFEAEIEDDLDIKYKDLYDEYLENNEQRDTSWKGSDSSIPPDWMTSYDVYDETRGSNMEDHQDPWQMKYGTPEPDSEITSVPCGGCGALLHCKDPAIPGYLPSELMIYKHEGELRTFNCQRCHFMQNYNVSLDVKVSSEEYPKLMEKIKWNKAAVILMVDLMDFPCSIWPDLPKIIGEKVPIFLVGNKIDLLPQDTKDFFEHVKRCLIKSVLEAGIEENNIKHVSLISAKTHFGVENLISALWRLWKYRGDLYLIGCTNAGKSSLFNAMLQSDYCQVSAVDLVQRATIAPWPGTTLNLLKFPILRPIGWRLFQRAKRLQAERDQRNLQKEHKKYMYSQTRKIEFATLQGHLGRSFEKPANFDASKNEDIFIMDSNYLRKAKTKFMGLDDQKWEYRKSKWCYDTPGTIQPDQVLHFLTTEELLLTLPKQIISPRSFVFKPGCTLFLAGMGRVDMLDGPEFIRCTVFASRVLPVTICRSRDADVLYDELLKTKAFVVPVNDPERLKLWPEMKSKEFVIEGINEAESAADVTWSSAGWISITPNENEKVRLRFWTPEGRGIYLRTPSLLRRSIDLRGRRLPHTLAYKAGKNVFPNY